MVNVCAATVFGLVVAIAASGSATGNWTTSPLSTNEGNSTVVVNGNLTSFLSPWEATLDQGLGRLRDGSPLFDRDLFTVGNDTAASVMRSGDKRKKAAVAHFELGLKALHSFMYALAVQEFEKATTLESCMPLAHAMKSLANAKALWNDIDWVAGRAAMEAFPGNCSGVELTPTEIGYASAVRALWNGNGTSPTAWAENAAAFAEEMEKEYASLPRPDSAAWVGLAHLVVSAANGTAVAGHNGGKGAAHGAKSMGPAGSVVRAREVLQKWAESEHPGVLHYILHAWDFPSIEPAPIGGPNVNWTTPTKAGETYMRMVSMACHALHMPSHVEMRLGQWNASERSNNRSVEAGDLACKIMHGPGSSNESANSWGRLNLFCDEDNIYHSLEYLANDLVQLGRLEAATTTLGRIDDAANAALSMPACSKPGGAKVLGLSGVETCSDKYVRWAYRVKARIPMETALLSPLSKWRDNWARVAAKLGINSAVPRRKLGRNASFPEDSYWSPLSEAGMIMAGAGAEILDRNNSSSSAKDAVERAKGRLAELSAGLREANHDRPASYLDAVSFMVQGLASWAGGSAGGSRAAVSNLTAAIKLQERLVRKQTASDPTLLFIPSWELLGQLTLADAGGIQPIVDSSQELAAAMNVSKANASALFSRVLQLRPGRAVSLLGRCRALVLEGEPKAAVDSCWQQLEQLWEGADVGLRKVIRSTE